MKSPLKFLSPSRAAAAVLLAVSGAAQASTVLYSTGFEAPTFTANAALAGQDGWSSDNSASSRLPLVTSFGGSQVLQIRSPELTQFHEDFHGVTYSAVGNAEQIVRFETDAYLIDNASAYVLFGVWGDQGFIGQLYTQAATINDTTVYLGLANSSVGGLVLSKNAWHHFSMDLDFSTGMQSASVDGTFIGTGAMAGNSTSLTSFGLGKYPGGNNGSTVYLDNLSVTSVDVPEPTSLALVSLALVGAAFGRRKAA